MFVQQFRSEYQILRPSGEKGHVWIFMHLRQVRRYGQAHWQEVCPPRAADHSLSGEAAGPLYRVITAKRILALPTSPM